MGQITQAPRANTKATVPIPVLVTVAIGVAVLAGVIGFLAGRLSRRSSIPQSVSTASVVSDAVPAAASDPEVSRNTAERHITATPIAVIAPSEAMPNLRLTGSGQQATEFVELPEGLCRIQLRHDGSSNFAVWLLDSSGKRVELLVNRVGPFDGAKSVRIPHRGRYLFDISADGTWEVSTSTPATAGDVAYFSGADQTSTEQFTASGGLHVFRLTHQGDSNFAVWLLDDRGKRVELLVNTTGPFAGSKAVRLVSGRYSLDVSANGSWTIERQSP